MRPAVLFTPAALVANRMSTISLVSTPRRLGWAFGLLPWPVHASRLSGDPPLLLLLHASFAFYPSPSPIRIEFALNEVDLKCPNLEQRCQLGPRHRELLSGTRDCYSSQHQRLFCGFANIACVLRCAGGMELGSLFLCTPETRTPRARCHGTTFKVMVGAGNVRTALQGYRGLSL